MMRFWLITDIATCTSLGAAPSSGKAVRGQGLTTAQTEVATYDPAPRCGAGPGKEQARSRRNQAEGLIFARRRVVPVRADRVVGHALPRASSLQHCGQAAVGAEFD